MGPEMTDVPYRVLEMQRKRNIKEQQIKFFKKIHRKKEFKKRRCKVGV